MLTYDFEKKGKEPLYEYLYKNCKVYKEIALSQLSEEELS